MPTNHRIPSLGYCIYSKRNKLKEEYCNLTPKYLKDLRSKRTTISNEVYVPEIAFTGDSLLSGIIDKSEFLTAKVLIMECTFLSDISIDDAHSGFHVHISEVAQNHTLFLNNAIILTHFSDKYSLETIIEEVSKALEPTSLCNKTYILINKLLRITDHQNIIK